MRAKEWNLMADCIERGVAAGLRRYYKHRDDGPSQEELDRMVEYATNEVQNEVGEWFYFNGPMEED